MSSIKEAIEVDFLAIIPRTIAGMMPTFYYPIKADKPWEIYLAPKSTIRRDDSRIQSLGMIIRNHSPYFLPQAIAYGENVVLNTLYLYTPNSPCDGKRMAKFFLKVAESFKKRENLTCNIFKAILNC